MDQDRFDRAMALVDCIEESLSEGSGLLPVRGKIAALNGMMDPENRPYGAHPKDIRSEDNELVLLAAYQGARATLTYEERLLKEN